MYAVLLIVHLIVCLGLIAVVLVQSGKGGGLAGGAFGGSAQTVFGGRGATDFITRATMVLGGLFFVTSLVLALMSSGLALGGRGRSLIQEEARKGAQTAPAPVTNPGAQPPAGGQTPAPAGGQTPSGGTPPPPGGGR